MMLMKPEKLIQPKPDEQILAVIHEDVIPYVPWMTLFFVWIVAPFFLLFPLFEQGLIGVIIFVALLGSGLFVGFRRYFTWQHTVFVITDQRVVDVDQRGFFDRTYSEIGHHDIQDVTFRIKGILPTIFRYGTLVVKTAGSAADLEMRRVRYPAKFHDLINDLRAEAKTAVPKLTRTRKLKELVDHMSDDEVNQLVATVRAKDQEDAIEAFTQPDEGEDPA